MEVMTMEAGGCGVSVVEAVVTVVEVAVVIFVM